MKHLAFASLCSVVLTLGACDSPGDKKPVSAPQERSQIVEAKAGDAAPVQAAPVVQAATSSAPKPPRVLCAGQMSGPGRALAKKPVSQSVASGEAPLPEGLALGGGFTWVNFWAAWCAPCKEEIPRLLGFEQKLAASGAAFRVSFVSLDDDERQLHDFLESQPVAGLHASYWLKEGNEREDWLKSAGQNPDAPLPFHLLVDPKGKIRCAIQGAVEDADFTEISGIVSAR